ncbi:MAG TPA: cytosine permease [Pseudolysinimonas sp.]
MKTDTPAPSTPAKNGIELTGLETIAESERKGRPFTLFWPWFAANVSVLAISYGSFVLGFGISFWQATIVAVIGITLSFLACGFISLAGRRGSAPTMVLSRAAFGVNGNRLVSIISWLLTVGWETVLTVLSVLAISTVVGELGGPKDNVVVKLVSLIVIAAIIVVAGVYGFTLIIRLQVIITIVTGVATVIYLVLVAPKINLDAVMAIPAAGPGPVIGALVLLMTGFGLGWVNAAADYSRYLPRTASARGVIGWTTFGGAIAPVVLVIFGVLIAGSSKGLSTAIGGDPIGALTTLLPVWFLIPFAIVAILGLIGGAVLDIYSSGLALLSAGLKVPRPVAAGIDGVIMVIGAIAVVFFAKDFVGPFEGFLITLGVPIAAWAGVFLADILLRKKDYADGELYQATGRYGSVNWLAIALIVVGTAIGWGFVLATSSVPWLNWQGYLLGLVGGKDGAWAYANLGVLFALVIGFVGTLIGGRARIKRQEHVA